MSGHRKPRLACPICGRPPAPESRPFCSPRCADADLARWMNGLYRIPGAALESDPETVENDTDGAT